MIEMIKYQCPQCGDEIEEDEWEIKIIFEDEDDEPEYLEYLPGYPIPRRGDMVWIEGDLEDLCFEVKLVHIDYADNLITLETKDKII